MDRGTTLWTVLNTPNRKRGEIPYDFVLYFFHGKICACLAVLEPLSAKITKLACLTLHLRKHATNSFTEPLCLGVATDAAARRSCVP